MLKSIPMDDPTLLPTTVRVWIFKNINKPIAGFEHKTKPDGDYYDHDEQLKATRYQVELIALSYHSRGKSAEEILCRLEWFT